MESDTLSDVDVLEDLLHDVNSESDNFEDLEEVTNDMLLTTDGQSDKLIEAEEFKAVLPSPRSTMFENSLNAALSDDAFENHDEDLSRFGHKTVKQGVLDSAANTNENITKEQDEHQYPNFNYENDAVTPSQMHAAPLSVDTFGQVEEERESDTEMFQYHDDAYAVISLNADRSEEVEGANKVKEIFSSEIHGTKNGESSTAVMPPPIPTTLIVGLMNPIDDYLESDDSQDEEDDAKMSLPPPLQSYASEDDDEDILEIDAAVVSSLQIEENQRLAEHISEPKSVLSFSEEECADLEDYLSKKIVDKNERDFHPDEIIREAHMTNLESSNPSSNVHKMDGGSKTRKSNNDVMFGIHYQGKRKKSDAHQANKNYSLPSDLFSGDFGHQNDMALESDLVFSVSTGKPESSSLPTDNDEFDFDENSGVNPSVFSKIDIKVCLGTHEAQQRKEHEKIVGELKRETDEERRRNITHVPTQPDKAKVMPVDTSNSMSLTELHNIYKRGLGDQEVLLDDKDDSKSFVGQPASLLGRLFGQDQTLSKTIVEEADGNDSEEEKMSNHGRNKFDLETSSEDNVRRSSISEMNNVDGSAEWREVKLVQHGQLKEIPDFPVASNSSNDVESAFLSYAEAATYYTETPDVMQHKDLIISEDFTTRSCFACLSRPRLTFEGSTEERDRVFCIAATAFDGHNKIVIRMLQTIYKKVTTSSRNVSLIGMHWESIGFQGTDPSTDLRGCGVLSLLQMLYLVENFHDLSHRFYALSQHPSRHFPFACVLINTSLQCVVALRNGALYPECNKQSSILSGMNRLYVALVSQLHDAILSQVNEIPHILKYVLDRGRASPTKVINEVFTGDSLPPSHLVCSTKPDPTEPNTPPEFSEIGLHPADE
ncbi:Uncharacterized conserved protein [Plasmopara halstedii]|uniref:Uncharacterized conserved protein n=1 Tax=Plasmopara halstedii TaxID=4781 RepID=A0A0P1AWY4_PLAHL|nr:Uncharacterized conserved protein [Plasmopara halstedii]CEG45672.1 Uncharacterized conserved protein [Plasmopara halstedii]|eukprot:XP_024582041.1 Uncharacterized conserved protein [Plasmopara halstedii]